MAINNCLFSPTSQNCLRQFAAFVLVWCLFDRLAAKTHIEIIHNNNVFHLDKTLTNDNIL